MSMQSILSASMSLGRIQTMHSVQTQNEGRINVLKAEIKQDGGNENKEEQVKALEEHSSNITGSLMDELNEVNEKLTPSEDSETGEAAKTPNTDKVDLSHRGEDAEQDGGKAVRSETPVSYNAEGKVNETASPSGKQVDSKA